jgi:prephenate dehydrogenase
MVDSDRAHAALAQDLVGSKFDEVADLVVFALPSSKLKLVIKNEFELNPLAAFIDVGSIKTKPQVEIEAIEGMAKRFCGTHPMAGRESGGPEAARADLFDGRPWVYTPGPSTQSDVLATVLSVITSLGAIPIEMNPLEHDKAVALISHLPQISASLLAKQIANAPREWLGIAGQGLRDSTRIAHSDPALWREIISMNRAEIEPLLIGMRSDLADLISHLSEEESIEGFLREGQKAVVGIPGKHGGKAREYFYLPIVIEDKPGQLGALFHECAEAKVNVEDLTIEHSPGQFTGLITLALSKSDGVKLALHLEKQGWKVHALR